MVEESIGDEGTVRGRYEEEREPKEEKASKKKEREKQNNVMFFLLGWEPLHFPFKIEERSGSSDCNRIWECKQNLKKKI